MRKSKRKSSTKSNNSKPITELSKSCIFCNKDKYVKGTRTGERLSDCTTICADERVRKVAFEQNDTALIAIASDELIAKEAHYHATCYRSYTRLNYTPVPEKRHDSDLNNVWKFLSNVYDNPVAVPFKRLQELVATPSEKKNRRGTIENRTDCYKFIKIEKEFLNYPTSLEMETSLRPIIKHHFNLKNFKRWNRKRKLFPRVQRL